MVVVDRTVENDAQAELVVDERLVGAVAQVHDAQAAMAEATAAQAEYALPVGAAPRHAFCHVRDRPYIGELLIESQFSGNSTHESFTPEINAAGRAAISL